MSACETALVVGCGSIGTRHVRNLEQLGIKTIVVFDVDEEKRRATAERHDVVPVSSLDDGLGHGPDVTLICVPNAYHVQIARQAAEHGSHLFIEKPLSNDMTGVAELRETVEEQGLTAVVGCNLRFHPALRRIKELLSADRIGTVVAVRIEFGSYLPSWHPENDYRERYSARESLGGGVILDHTHEIDYARWLFGDVRTVSCFLDQASHLEIETEDTAALLLRFNDGTIGELHLDYVQREYSRGCQVVGDEGTIRWTWGDGEVRWTTAETSSWNCDPVPTSWEFDRTYVDELEHLLDCVAGEADPVCDLNDGVAALRIALAAKESQRTGRHIDLA